MKLRKTTFAVLIVIVALVVSVCWFFFRNPYANIVVGEAQPTNVTINGVEYVFTKSGNDLAIYPWDESHYPQTGIFSVQEGQTYQWLGIEITVVEVHADRFVLNIKPLD